MYKKPVKLKVIGEGLEVKSSNTITLKPVRLPIYKAFSLEELVAIL